MTTLWSSFSNDRQVERGIAVLRDSHVDATAVHLLRPGAKRDRRELIRGAFEGPLNPDDPVGNFGDRPTRRHQAEGGFAGDVDEHRQGTFADTDEEVLVDFPDWHATERSVHDEELIAFIADSGLSRDATLHVLEHLNLGHPVLIATVPEQQASHIRQRLETATSLIG